MKTTIGFLLCICAFHFLPPTRSSAQERPVPPDTTLSRVGMPFLPPQPRMQSPTRYTIPGKRASQYTTEDWGRLIDSTWGAGQPASEQLYVFDTFWSKIDREWAGFPNLALNWDSLCNFYRPQIGSGLSRGRFYGLMSRMWTSLTELHTYISDPKVNLAFNDNPFQYRRGVPLLCMAPVRGSLIGAAVTPLPDSTNLVYRAAPGNPLGLEPGDLILGYEGIPWGRLFQRLIDAGLPVNNAPFIPASTWGSTPESASHFALMSVGCNWGLFDTIDVVKYSSGDTLHLSTAPLDGYTQVVQQSDQVGVAGVPLPVAPGGPNAVSWGVVQGTNIGYIHVWDWATAETQNRFSAAVSDLCETKKVEGLVLDFRMNWGGTVDHANGGFSQLFNFDPTAYLSIARRNNVNDHYGFSFTSSTFGFAPTHGFDRPIAALIGPGCVSAGDFNAFRLRFHPMVRFFGRPTNGAFVGGSSTSATFSDGWEYYFWTGMGYSTVPAEGFLIHTGIQPDEQVWLTRDGVAKGEDDVAKRALEWITTLTYAHDVRVDRPFARSGQDSITLTSKLTNPLSHTASVSALISDIHGSVYDTLELYDDGLHGDSSAGDGVMGARFHVPAGEEFFTANVTTTDHTAGSNRTLPLAGRFTTAGPMVCVGDTSNKLPRWGQSVMFRFKFRNDGATAVVNGVKATVRSLDTAAVVQGVSLVTGGNVSPGQTILSGVVTIKFSAFASGIRDVPFEVTFSSQDVEYWRDTCNVQVNEATEVALGGKQVPLEYALGQNYPNPFNPSTTIRYELPHSSRVTLKVYNTLGQDVATLVNDTKPAGVYMVEFDARSLASGIYFYGIQVRPLDSAMGRDSKSGAGNFVDTKRLILLR